jgi:hypothetical protein
MLSCLDVSCMKRGAVGVIALFDKSFIQSLTVDESVWFDRFFVPVVCPLFYVETAGRSIKEA